MNTSSNETHFTSEGNDNVPSHHCSRQSPFELNQRTPLLQRIVLRRTEKGQYRKTDLSHMKANSSTDENYAFAYLEQPTKSNWATYEHTTTTAFAIKQRKSDSLGLQATTHCFTPSLPLNTRRSLTLKGLFASLFAPLRFASSSASASIELKKRDRELLSSSCEFTRIQQQSTMSHESREQRREEQQKYPQQYSFNSDMPSRNLHQFQASSSTTEQKLLKSIRMYAFGICAIALCCTGALVLADGMTPPTDTYSDAEGMTRSIRVVNEGNQDKSQQASHGINSHRRFHDSEGFVAKLRDDFHEWIEHHGREYGSDEEKEKRFHIWKENHMRYVLSNELKRRFS